MKKRLKEFLKKMGMLDILLNVRDSLLNLLNRKKRIQFYSQFVKNGDTCFDVGANLGNRTDIFLKLGAKVVAVEPQNSCMEILQKKYSKNESVKLVHCALGEEVGTAVMKINSSSTLSSISNEWIEKTEKSGRFTGSNWQGEQKIKIDTMDNLVKKYGLPALCKIDVEGFEEHVLKGLTSPIQVISFEFAFESLESSIRCVEYLSKIGKYKFNYSLGEEMTFVLDGWFTKENMLKMLKECRDSGIWGDIYAKIG